MPGRVYEITVDAIAVSAVADIIWLSCPTDSVVYIEEIIVTQEASELSEQMPLFLFRTTTDNSAAGTSNTPNPTEVGDPAYGGVVRHNIVGGSLSAETTPIRRQSQNQLNGWHWKGSELDPILIMTPAAATAGRAALKLDVAPSTGITMDAYMRIREIGG